MLRGRIPRFQKKIVDVGLVDRADRGIGVSIRGQQGAFGSWEDLAGGLQESHSVHVRHPLIREQKGYAVVANFESFEKIERALRGIAADHAILRSVLRAQVSLNGTQHISVIVDRQ
jgi:hypothetical protein